MPFVPKWRRFLRFWRADVAADVDAELQFHFESRIAELVALGMSETDARRRTYEEFGDVDAWRARMREVGERLERRHERLTMLRAALADLRYAARSLRATPLFTVGVAVTLATGIGATTAMYGVMRRLLLEAPPGVAAPERVAKLFFRYQSGSDSARTVDRSSYPFYEQLRDAVHSVDALAVYSSDEVLAVGRGADAQRARVTMVSAGFWRTLGARPALGRFIADPEAHPATGERVAVLGHAFWLRRYGGARTVVGTALQVKGQPYRIVGVAPRGFRGVELTDTDLWLPLFALGDGEGSAATWHTFASSFNLAFVVRRKPSASARQVGADVTAQLMQLLAKEEEMRPARHRRATPPVRASALLPPLTGALGGNGTPIPEATVAVWLVGVATILLAIACANVAGLLLLRTLRRRREIAVRLALGMSRRRLAALLFTESLVLALLGGAGSVVVAIAANAWVRRVLIAGMVGESAGVDWPTLAVAAGCVAATALLAGLAPMLHTRPGAPAGLNDGAQHGATRRSRVYTSLLVTQTALSIVLLVGAGLFVQSLHRVTAKDLGVDIDNVAIVSIDFSGSGRPRRDVMAFYERALERVRAIPGVRAASLAYAEPYGTRRGAGIRLPGASDWFRAPQGSQYVNRVTPDYFASNGMRLLQGRAFTEADRTGAPVIIVEEALARAAWPGRSPLGECVATSGSRTRCATVVGVARSEQPLKGGGREILRFYMPLNPADIDDRVLIVRQEPGMSRLSGTIRSALQQVDPALPYIDVSALASRLDSEIRPWRLGAAVFSAFGVLAALLAALGLYSAIAYAVTQRSREIGVRLALGAPARNVLALVLGDGTRIAFMGIAIGLCATLALGPWVQRLLFETSPRDPRVLVSVAAALLLIVLLATLAPARRAMRVDPARTLRAE